MSLTNQLACKLCNNSHSPLSLTICHPYWRVHRMWFTDRPDDTTGYLSSLSTRLVRSSQKGARKIRHKCTRAGEISIVVNYFITQGRRVSVTVRSAYLSPGKWCKWMAHRTTQWTRSRVALTVKWTGRRRKTYLQDYTLIDLFEHLNGWNHLLLLTCRWTRYR